MKTIEPKFKLKAVHIRRLRKLIAFLDELPPEKFDFAEIRCGSVGCAVGWTPNVFPKEITLRRFRLMRGSFPGLRGRRNSGFANVAEWLTGLDETSAALLFQPGDQKIVHRWLPSCNTEATPKQVARMLEKFIALHQ